MIGQRLADHLSSRGQHVVSTTRRSDRVSQSRPQVDLAAQLWPDFSALIGDRPATAYICAAVARIAACEADPSNARAVNVNGCTSLATHLVAVGANIVALSTNQVLSGQTPRESADAPHAPATEYGRQKAELERRVLALGPQVKVLRLTKVFGELDPLLNGWRKTLRCNLPISPFVDMSAAPVKVDDVASTLAALGTRDGHGVYQYSASRDVSYAEMASAIAAAEGCAAALVRPQSSREAGLAFSPPRFTSLCGERLMREFSIAQPDPIQVALMGGYEK